MIWTVKAERMNIDPVPQPPIPPRVIVSHEMTEDEASRFYERTLDAYGPEWRISLTGGGISGRGRGEPGDGD